MIAARGLRARFDEGPWVLDGVDLELSPGEVLGVAGPNGAGKSTLVAALAGDAMHVEGEVDIDGRSLRDLDERTLARLRAVMSQHVDLAFAFTALEVVLMGRAPHVPIETEACRTLALRGLRELGIEGLASRPYPTLSGGEQQRVQLARVLTQIGFGESGRYLLLDEPVSSLDPAQQHAALGCVRRIAQGGVGVLVVLHDLNLLAQYTDRLALLSGGRVRRVGAPRDVLEPALLGEVFDVEAHVSKLPWNEEAPWIVLRGR